MKTLDKSEVCVYDFLKKGSTDSACIKDCLEYSANSLNNPAIVFNKKDWYIDEAILLPSNTTIIIDGCMIKQKDEVFDNVFRGNNVNVDPENTFGKPLSVSNLQNIKIIGINGAKIVGCDINRKGYHPVMNEIQDMVGDFWGWRTLQISLSKCDGFEISGIEFLQTRCWALSFDFCCNGYIHDLHINTNVKNGDGIDFRAGCHHCRVERITGYTSDDTVACTALNESKSIYPYKNYLYPLEPANSIWCGEDIRSMDIHDISISDISTGGKHHGVICLAACGLRVHNITIKNIHEETNGQREAAVKIYTGYGDDYTPNDIHHIEVSSVNSYISDYAVLCNTKVEYVILKDITQRNSNGKLLQLSCTDGISIFDFSEPKV